jgi:DME family drug/metabolite transporter
MIGIFLALLAALIYSLGAVLVRKRVHESNLISVSFVITVVSNVVLWPLTFMFTDLRTVNYEGILFFAIAGILAPGIHRILYYKGISVLGASINASIFATYPIYTSTLAVLLLKEAFTPLNGIGVVCVSCGVIYLERSLSEPGIGKKRISKRSLVFPFLAGLAIALSQIIRKHGLNIYSEPLLVVSIGNFVSFMLYSVLTIFYSERKSRVSSKDFRLFWKAGVCLAVAWLFISYALSVENASVVAPLLQTQPLFILLFTYLYLKEVERISPKLILGAILIVIGVILVSIK